MPRPHYPATGGPHLPSWNMREARQRHRPQAVAPPAVSHAVAQANPPAHPSPAGAVGATRKAAQSSRPSAIPTSPSSARRTGVFPAMLWLATFLSPRRAAVYHVCPSPSRLMQAGIENPCVNKVE